jgi:ATP-dependent helicase HrpA/adenine-specific DNA-methyltransferase
MSIIQTARQLRKHDTWAERLLWRWLRDRRFGGYKFRRQHPFKPYVLDFFCMEAMVNIELDGSGHARPDKRRRDAERDKFLEDHGIKVLRFPNSNLRRNRKAVEYKIAEALRERAPLPLAPEIEMAIAASIPVSPPESRAVSAARKAAI